ncbi:MAG: YhjD/YihY/BrkB family envelope integrity protein [Limisphaerales bacterium]
MPASWRTSRFPRLIKILSGVQTGAETEFNRLERFAHFWALVGKSFARNRCPVRAAALSYSTLLALIPMLAVAVSVTSSLLKKEGEEKIYQLIDRFVSNVMPPATLNSSNSPDASPNFPSKQSARLQPTNFTAAVTFTNTAAETNSSEAIAGDNERVVVVQKKAARSIHEFIQNTRSGTLGVIGMLVLVYVAIMMLANIETTFNDIWGVTRGRNWMLRVVLYWATITLGPLLLITAVGLAGGSQMQAAREFIGHAFLIGGLISNCCRSWCCGSRLRCCIRSCHTPKSSSARRSSAASWPVRSGT